MFGIIYLILACFIGCNLVMAVFPGLYNISAWRGLKGQEVRLDKHMVLLPAAFLTGTLVVTWFTYLACCMFYLTDKPMLYGNIVSLAVTITVSVFFYIKNRDRYKELAESSIPGDNASIKAAFSQRGLETAFLLTAVALCTFLMFYTFNIKGNTIYVGRSVWGDFGPHLAVIRSFSMGSNFPTEYPHFAAGSIRYHFLFQFLTGNLEFLGLRIDWAFNLPSILSMMAFLMLLYSFANLLTGKRWVGILASILFFFRSSFAFFTFLSGMEHGSSILAKILGNDVYIGKTTNENWGLWTQNVYVNQRHLAFALAVLLMLLIIMYPLYKKMIDALSNIRKRQMNVEAVQDSAVSDTSERKGIASLLIKEFILKADAWLPEDIGRSAAAGVLLGLISFWNGAVVFAAMPVLFLMAVFSKHRLEYLNTAIITVVLSLMQTAFFIGPDSQAVSPKLFIGFLAEQKNLQGIISYFVEMLGLLPFVIIAALFAVPKGMRWLTLAFLSPLIMAVTLQLTPDINANHKFIIIAVILLNITAAYLLYRLFSSRKTVPVIIAALLTMAMTVTGAVDLITLCNLNTRASAVTTQTDDPILAWVTENTGPNEIFLTDVHVMHPILLAGRKIFYGWPYYAWSAGYNTYGREADVNRIYGATSSNTLRNLVKDNNISYIVIETGNKNAKVYKLNKKLIEKTFKLVYENAGRDIAIYRTY